MTASTPLQQLARVNRDIETQKGATDFARLVQHVLAHKGKFSDVALAAGRSSRDFGGPRLADILKAGAGGGIGREYFKAATTAGTLAGQPLADYGIISGAFVASLANVSAFDTMLASMIPVPLQTGTVGSVSVGAQGFTVSEGSAKPVSKLTVTGQQMNPTKAHCIVVISQELARAPGANAIALIGRELRNTISVATDAAFVAILIAGLSVATSTGSTAESVRADIANLLRAISTGASSKLFILTTSLTCKSWSMLTSGAHGDSAFEDLTPMGGMINGIPVFVSDGVPVGDVILADASGIAAASGDLVMQEFREGSLQFESVPDSPPLASSAYISLWQQNLVGLMIERWLVAVRLRSDAVAMCSNSNSYQSGNSPP